MIDYPQMQINPDLNAPNVIELQVDHSLILQSFTDVEDILGNGFFQGTRESPASGIGLYSFCADWNGDLRWVSASNEQGFAFFDKYFEALEIQERTQAILGDCGELIMYSGFYVIRSETTEPYYHYDYSTGVGMNAMTLMTPVAATGEDGNLLYENMSETESVYKYRPGVGISFGAEFHHSTQPFKSDIPYAFLCFTYGLRDADQWDLIAETVTEQGVMYRHPIRGIVRTINQ